MKQLSTFSICFVFLLSSLMLSAQHKIYKGAYKLGNDVGQVEYSYLESPSGTKRILDGYFIFKNTSLGRTYTIEGNFSRDLKDGEWTYIQPGNLISNIDKKYFRKGKIYGNYKINDDCIQFKDNHFTGDFVIYYGGNSTFVGGLQVYERHTYTGQFDENGYADGEWIEKKMLRGVPHTKTQIWENGILRSSIEINESTGTKINVKADYKNHPIISKYYWGSEPNTTINDYDNTLKMGEIPMTIFPFRGENRKSISPWYVGDWKGKGHWLSITNKDIYINGVKKGTYYLENNTLFIDDYYEYAFILDNTNEKVMYAPSIGEEGRNIKFKAQYIFNKMSDTEVEKEKKERAIIKEKKERELKEKAEREKKEQEKQERQKIIAERVALLENSDYENYLSKLKDKISFTQGSNQEINFDEIKKETLLDNIKSKAYARIATLENMGTMTLTLPIEFQFVKNYNLVPSKEIIVIDNTGDKWFSGLKELKNRKEFFYFNNDAGSGFSTKPSIWYECDKLSIFLNDKGELFIKKGSKKKRLQYITGKETSLPKGLYYMGKTIYPDTRFIDLKQVTIEEVNKTIRERAIEQSGNGLFKFHL